MDLLDIQNDTLTVVIVAEALTLVAAVVVVFVVFSFHLW